MGKAAKPRDASETGLTEKEAKAVYEAGRKIWREFYDHELERIAAAVDDIMAAFPEPEVTSAVARAMVRRFDADLRGAEIAKSIGRLVALEFQKRGVTGLGVQ
jgi:hypothetical protein